MRFSITRVCSNCSSSYTPTGANQKFCTACISSRNNFHHPDDAKMVCTKCGNEKSIFDFTRRYKNKAQRHEQCRDCKGNYRRAWIKTLEENPAARWKKRNPEKEADCADRYILKKMGLTLEQYKIINERQRGLCAICNKPNTFRGRRRLVFDHCHASGKFRGLICHYCNLVLGAAKDKPETLIAAAQYLDYARYAETFDPAGLGC